MSYRIAFVALLVVGVSAALAADAIPPIQRKLPPPPSAKVSPEDRAKLEAELAKVQQRLKAAEARPEWAELLPDVQVYEKAVRYALQHEEFYEAKRPATRPAQPSRPAAAPKATPPKATAPKSETPRGVTVALDLLKSANKRLDELEAGKPSWTDRKGPLVRGYRSDVDGSAQPYGLDITDDVDLSKPAPLYVWLHGRGDTETDLYFIKNREAKGGELRPKGAIVLHPFGRHCVGFKSAGEVDVLDAIESVKQRYKVDADRIVLAGFSMGGAGAWHVGAHHPDRFAAVHPGAGFVDVRRYQNVDPAKVAATERLLWGVYDVPDYVRNLFNVPVVSYSGENDRQRASANVMAEAFKAEGKELTQFIGPNVEHKWLPLPDMLKLLDEHVRKGRDPHPKEVCLQTKTLRYNKMFWVEALGLGEHWADARIDAKVAGDNRVEVTTRNVTSLRLKAPAATAGTVALVIDGNATEAPARESGWVVVRKTGDRWEPAPPADAGAGGAAVRKRPGLQGPIDDAFVTPFLFVAPTGHAASPAVQRWVEFEMAHQQDRWRALMRGDLRVKKDTEVTPQDVQSYNLVLWGDAKSNQVIGRLADKLPAKWAGGKLTFAGRSHDAATHVPALIYPNPQNPTRYVVLNSGLTFREDHDRTNSIQNPKLGDWAILDVTTPPTAAAPGKVVENGFFDEAWQPKPPAK